MSQAKKNIYDALKQIQTELTALEDKQYDHKCVFCEAEIKEDTSIYKGKFICADCIKVLQED